MTSAVSIHLITPGKASLLDRVHDDVFDNAVEPSLVEAFLANPANVLVVAVAEGTVIGMASGIAYVHPDKPLQMFVNEVGVAERFRRRGIGKELVSALLEQARKLGCGEAWVATEVGNVAARALYTSLGGTEDPENAVVYTYELKDLSVESDPSRLDHPGA